MSAKSMRFMRMVTDKVSEQQNHGVPRGAFKVPGASLNGRCVYVVFSGEGPDRSAMDFQAEVVRASLEGLGLKELGCINSTGGAFNLRGEGSKREFGWVMLVQSKTPSPTQLKEADSLETDPVVTQLDALVRQAWVGVLLSPGASAA